MSPFVTPGFKAGHIDPRFSIPYSVSHPLLHIPADRFWVPERPGVERDQVWLLILVRGKIEVQVGKISSESEEAGFET